MIWLAYLCCGSYRETSTTSELGLVHVETQGEGAKLYSIVVNTCWNQSAQMMINECPFVFVRHAQQINKIEKKI